MPGKPAVGGTDYLGLAYLLLVLAVAFGPMILGRPAPPPDPDDPGRDDGGVPPDPPPPPGAPTGGALRPDAEPARVRLRDHSRLADSVPPRQRRPAPTPR